jgi:hypothetical protein
MKVFISAVVVFMLFSCGGSKDLPDFPNSIPPSVIECIPEKTTTPMFFGISDYELIEIRKPNEFEKSLFYATGLCLEKKNKITTDQLNCVLNDLPEIAVVKAKKEINGSKFFGCGSSPSHGCTKKDGIIYSDEHIKNKNLHRHEFCHWFEHRTQNRRFHNSDWWIPIGRGSITGIQRYDCICEN